jgi:hypothetical protein
MSGEVFVVRAVPASVKPSDGRLATATDRDSRKIDDVKHELASTDRRNGTA